MVSLRIARFTFVAAVVKRVQRPLRHLLAERLGRDDADGLAGLDAAALYRLLYGFQQVK